MVFILPVLTVAWLCASVLYSPWLVVMAAMTMSWSVHISFHEAVHRCGPGWRGVLAGIMATPIMGLPLDGYRLHHRNHHLYNNEESDVSCTWVRDAGGVRPRNRWWYAVSWPTGLMRSMIWARGEALAGRVEPWIHSRLRMQQALLVVVLVVLACFTWWWLALYLMYVWLGWTFISLHNYGQHPPFPGGIVSIHLRWYNWLMHRNGLHVEHHASPQAPIAELQVDVHAPHTCVPFFVPRLLIGRRS